MDGQRKVFSCLSGAVGLRRVAADKVERSRDYAGVGPSAHAASNAGAGMGFVRLRAAPGRELGRAALPEHVCQYARLSRFWTSRPYRYRGHTVLSAGVVAFCGNMAEPHQKE